MQVDRSTVQGSSSFVVSRGREAPPLYIQVALEMERRIRQGVYSAGEVLPSEPTLAAQLGVSRATIVKAFDTLEYQSMIERRQGRGTFALLPPSPNSLTVVASFSEVTIRSGEKPSHRLIEYKELSPGRNRPFLASAFSANESLVQLERVRLSNGRAVGHHLVTLPRQLCETAELTPERVADPSFSLYKALNDIDEAPDSANEYLQAVPCPAKVAEKLGITGGEPMMRVRRFTKNRFGHLIETVEAHYLGSLYEYQSRMISKSSDGTERSTNEQEATHSDRNSRDISVVVGERLRRSSS